MPAPARHSSPLAGQRVVDYGCGSGVLAIAAALLGASAVLAIDIDEQALQATRLNAAANGVDQCIVTRSAGRRHRPGRQI